MTRPYIINGQQVNPVELKCLVVSRGVKIDSAVYRAVSPKYRLDVSPLCCNCAALPDGTILQLTDMGFHLKYLSGILSWDNLKLLRYAGQLGTPFSVRMDGATPTLYHEKQAVAPLTFFPKTEFYRRKTPDGLPFAGNAVIQGCDWVAFQCLWPCEYAAAGKPCAFCFSGADFAARAQKGRVQPAAVSPRDMAHITGWAVENAGCTSVQITGGSTFSGKAEARHIKAYLCALAALPEKQRPTGEVLLYITPPENTSLIDEYFALGASRVACSLEVWDEALAAAITPGKVAFTTRARHLEALYHTAQKHGPGKAFSNFIIGLEPFESLKAGATTLAQRGVIPSASVWMPMGRPVQGSMTPPELDYYRRVIDLFATLYEKHGLEPAGGCGLNVCMERDIWRCHTARAATA